MHCMKCGRKTEDSHVFCPDCLTEMEKYPVKPGTVVKLPQHPTTPAAKKKQQYHHFRRPSDQIELLRVRSRWLMFAFIVTLICFIAAVVMILWLLNLHNYIDISWLGISTRNVSRETFPFLSIF